MRKNSWLLLFVLFLTSCAATGIVPIGNDTYMISKAGWIAVYPLGSLTTELYKNANAYCLKHNKKFRTVRMTTRPGVGGKNNPEAKLEFKCLETDQQKVIAEREQLEKERRRTAALRRAREKRTEEKAITPSRKVWRTAGSGFILRGTSYVLTSYHVFQKGVSIRATLPSGEIYPALVVTKDRNNDLALVQLKGMRPMGGFIAQLQAEVKTGELVHALGYPLGERLSRQPSIVTGYVSAGTGLEDNIAQFRMTTPINEGNSGGPIVNAQGTLVGIASSGLVQQGVEGIRFGTKISAAMLVLQQARLVRKFTIMAVPKERKVLTPPEIFREYSPYVVLIETR